MDASHWARILQLYHAAREVPAPERAAWLRKHLAGEHEEVVFHLTRMLAGGEGPEPPTPTALVSPGAGARAVEELIGLELGGWRLLREIGRGGLGVVYEALAVDGHERVALKVLQPGKRHSPMVLERFRREAEAAGRLDHAGIAKVLGAGQQKGLQYLVMERIEGRALSEILEGLRASAPDSAPERGADLRRPEVVAELVARIADALAYSHGEGVVHRDIKPQNVLIDPFGRPHIVDFGLAKDQAELDSLSRTGEIFGTPHYMSPEQAIAHRDAIDHRTDIYSLGAVMYELLTLHRPFDGATSQEIFFKIIHQEPRPIREFNPRAPVQLALICAQAMRREPALRYPRMADFAADLRRFARGERVHARRLSLLRRLRRQWNRPAVLTATAAVLLLCGAGGAAGWSSWQTRAQALSARPRIEVVLPAGAPDCEVALARPDELPPRYLPEPLGRTRGGRIELALEPGEVRILVRGAGGEQAELARTLVPNEHVRLEVRLTTLEAAGNDWAHIPGGAVQLELPGGDPVQIEVPGYFLERSCITNAQYQQFLASTGRATRDARPKQLAEPPSAPADWDLLPVVDVSFEDARAYCEWSGARLPTALEWELAGQSLLALLEPVAAGDAGLFVLGRPPYVLTPEKAPSTYLAYLQHAQPALEGAPELGAHGLRHMFGNVNQWTTSFQRLPSTERVLPDMRVSMGAPWHRLPGHFRQGRPGWRELAAGGPSFSTGFRRARSALP